MTDRNYEWDDPKRESNLRKHGFDFNDAVRLFDVWHNIARSEGYGEARWKVTAPFDGLWVTAVYTMRGDVVRIISMRSARNNEQHDYHKNFALRGSEGQK